MSNARKFLANYGILVSGDLSAKLLGFLVLAILARRLGAGRFGELAFATALVSYFSLVVRQGLDLYGIREVARARDKALSLAGKILGLRIVTSVAAIILWCVTVSTLHKPHDVRVFLFLIGLNLVTAALSLQWFFQALEKMKTVAIAMVLSQLSYFLCVASLVKDGSHLAWVPVCQFVGDIVAFGYIANRIRGMGGMKPSFEPRQWIPILSASIPMGVTGALGLILFNFDTVLLGFLKSSVEVGEYGAAYKVVTFFYAMLFLYSTTLLPLLSRRRLNKEALAGISGLSLRYTLLLAIPLAAGGTLVARPLMTLLFGEQFTQGASALQILIWTIPLVTARGLYRNALLVHDHQVIILRNVSICAAANVAMNLFFIPLWSYIGAAITTLIAETGLLILLYRQVAGRVLRMPLLPHLWRPLLATLPMAAVVVSLPGLILPLRIAAGATVYLVSARIAGAFSVHEILEILRTRDARPAEATAVEASRSKVGAEGVTYGPEEETYAGPDII